MLTCCKCYVMIYSGAEPVIRVGRYVHYNTIDYYIIINYNAYYLPQNTIITCKVYTYSVCSCRHPYLNIPNHYNGASNGNNSMIPIGFYYKVPILAIV